MITTAPPIVRRINGIKALIFRTIALISKKFFCKIAVIVNITIKINKFEYSGLKIFLMKEISFFVLIISPLPFFTPYFILIEQATMFSSVISSPSSVDTTCPSYIINILSLYWISSSLSLAYKITLIFSSHTWLTIN